MVLIEALGPRTVAGHSQAFYLDFILVLPYFRFRTVLPKLQENFGKIGEVVERCSANSMGAIWTAQLILTALHCTRRCTVPCAYRRSGGHSLCLQAKRGAFAAPIRCLCCDSPINSARVAVPIVWCSIRDTKEQAKRGHLCAALSLLLYNNNNAQRHSPRPLLNNWHYFQTNLMFPLDTTFKAKSVRLVCIRTLLEWLFSPRAQNYRRNLYIKLPD